MTLLQFLQQVVGNSLKSLEVSEDKANQRVEEFKRQLKTLTIKLKEAETRAENAEKNVKKLQKEVDRLEGRLHNWLIEHLLPRMVFDTFAGRTVHSRWFYTDDQAQMIVVALTFPPYYSI